MVMNTTQLDLLRNHSFLACNECMEDLFKIDRTIEAPSQA